MGEDNPFSYTTSARLAALPLGAITGTAKPPASKKVRYCCGLKIVDGKRTVCGTRLNCYNESTCCSACSRVPVDSGRRRPRIVTAEEFDAFLALKRKQNS